MVAGGIQTQPVERAAVKENGHWVEDMLAEYPGSYQVAGTLVAGPRGQERSLLQKIGGFFRDPGGSINRAVFAPIGRFVSGLAGSGGQPSGPAPAQNIDYTQSEAFDLGEIIVDGVRDAQRAVGQTWTDFTHAWNIQPQRQRGGETFFSAPPPSNPVTWVNGDIGIRRAAVRDRFAHADGLDAMHSVTNPWATNVGLSIRSGLERAHAGFANEFAVPFGVIDTVLGRPADAIGLRWNSPGNVTGHQMAEPAIGIGLTFVGNPEVLATSMAPKAIGIGIGRAEIGAAELLAAERIAGPVPTGEFYSVAFETKLSPTSYPGVSRGAHFQEANGSLLQAMEGDAVFASDMQSLGINLQRTPTGLAPRTSPSGWTWHHAQEPGVMQLVPRSQHQPGSVFQGALHPDGKGGYSIWGK